MREIREFLNIASSWIVLAIALYMIFAVIPAHAVPFQYCKNESVLVIQDNFTVCGPSPVLNPSDLECQQYNRSMEEVCAAGCANSQCTPLAFDRSILIAGVIIGVFVVILVIRRYG